MSLPAMSLGDWFCVSKKGWDRGRLVNSKVENSMAVSGVGCASPSVGPFLLF